jgi:predicted nuclease of predicted toxin-antitoxin system
VKLLIDLNLSPAWADYLARHDIEAQHWSGVGDPKATDRAIMAYAQRHGYVVFTHDLDFGNILAVTQANGPSVIQLRTEDPIPIVMGELLLRSFAEYAHHLQRGALITIEPDRLRARVLPIVPGIKR